MYSSNHCFTNLTDFVWVLGVYKGCNRTWDVSGNKTNGVTGVIVGKEQTCVV